MTKTMGVDSQYIKFEDHGILKREDEKKLFRMMRKATSNKDRIMIRNFIAQHNYKFARSVASTYKSKLAHIPFNDIIQNAMFGLFVSIDKYDPEATNKFITYAVWWIQQSIVYSMQEHECTVRMPQHFHRKFQIATKNKEYTTEIQNAIHNMMGSTSLNKVVSPDGKTTMGDFIQDNNEATDPNRYLFHTRLTASLNESLSKLTSKQRRVIESYFGVNRTRQNMDDIGEDLNIGRESIRIIKKKVLRLMGNHPSIKRLRDEGFNHF